jgi:hypothetical protein
MKASQSADHLEVAQFLSADVHEQIFALGVFAVQALNGVLHRSGEFPVRASELLEEHVPEAWIRKVYPDGIHKLLDVVIQPLPSFWRLERATARQQTHCQPCIGGLLTAEEAAEEQEEQNNERHQQQKSETDDPDEASGERESHSAAGRSGPRCLVHSDRHPAASTRLGDLLEQVAQRRCSGLDVRVGASRPRRVGIPLQPSLGHARA